MLMPLSRDISASHFELVFGIANLAAQNAPANEQYTQNSTIIFG